MSSSVVWQTTLFWTIVATATSGAANVENLAFNKTAYQITTRDSSSVKYPASLAVDGNKTTFAHTEDNYTNPWWAVDLGVSVNVSGVNLTSRNSSDHRNDNFIVGLLDWEPHPLLSIELDNYTKCGQYNGSVDPGSTVHLPCATGLGQYRYVLIQVNTSKILNQSKFFDVSEVEVYGVAASTTEPTTATPTAVATTMTTTNTASTSRGYGGSATSVVVTSATAFKDASQTSQTTSGSYNTPVMTSLSTDIDGLETPGTGNSITTTNTSTSVTVHIDSQQQMSTTNIAAIAGGVVGGIVLVAVIVIIVSCSIARERRKDSVKLFSKTSNMANGVCVSAASQQAVRDVNEEEFEFTSINGTSVKREQLEYYVKHLEATDGYNEQFNKLSNDDFSRCSTGSLSENRKKNRFLNILPYDETRVKLAETENVAAENLYINASLIKEYKGERIAYLASQAPKPETVEVFWEMIWQENVDCIVSLVLVMEDGKNRCYQYWPDSVNESITCGNFTVKLLEVDIFAEFAKRKLAFHPKDKPERTLIQLQYLVWPDRGVPDDVWSLTSFRHRVRKVLSLRASIADVSGQLLVHCSAGVGRTGTFIALDILLDEAAKTGRVDVFDVVQHLRQQRMKCVQTVEQYRLLYLALLDTHRTGITARRKSQLQPHHTTPNPKHNRQSIRQLEKEFQLLTLLRPALPPEDKLDALQPLNLNKNRKRTIVPTSFKTTVHLSAGGDGSDYINASVVKGYKMPIKYILTQLPLTDTVDDFWKMIVVEKCTSIVLLQQGSAKDPSLWPAKLNSTNSFGSTEVTSTNMKSAHSTTGSFAIHSLLVTGQVEDQQVELEVDIHELTSWTDDVDTPNDVNDYLELINLVNTRERPRDVITPTEDVTNRYGQTLIVLCLDGATRSGLYAATSLAIDRLKCDNELDVFLSCRYITSVRPHTIISQAQYDFVHQAAVKSMNWKSSLTFVDSDSLSTVGLPSGQGHDHIYDNVKTNQGDAVYANVDDMDHDLSFGSKKDQGLYENCGSFA